MPPVLCQPRWLWSAVANSRSVRSRSRSLAERHNTVLSDVAGITDKNGGFRVVVTERHRFKYHVGPGERLFVVPGLKVQEPIPFEEIRPIVIQVEEYITSRLAPRTNACG